jgi:AraC-like DNA-binding protein
MDGEQIAVFRASARSRMHERDVHAFREQISRDILRLEMTPLGGNPLECDVTIRALPELAVARGSLSPMRNHHPEHLGDDGIVIAVLESGRAELSTRGSTVAVSAGQAVLTANDEAGTFVGHTPTRVTNIRLRRQVLGPAIGEALARTDRLIPERTFPLRLLLSYAEAMTDPALALDPGARRVAISNVYDLAALAIGGVGDPRDHMSGLRAARLHALKTDTLARLGEPGLSLHDVATRQGISTSYARKLFAQDGTAFFEYLLEHRLAAAHRRLLNPHEVPLPISSIAFELGFGDLSYFNRTFRRRYGMTPSDVRALARGP